MGVVKNIDIELFKVVTRAVAHSDQLDLMANHLSQLIVGGMGIKGCNLFALDVATEQLEIIGGFGLSIDYVHKGPILSAKSIGKTAQGECVVVSDTLKSADMLQYPEEAKREGIRAIVSLPVALSGRVVGALRLYHSEVWEPSEADLDSLLSLAEVVGLAMMYSRLLNAVREVKGTVDTIHPVWLEP